MKKVILTISALLVSAAMVFSFAGCSGNTDDTKENNSDAAAVVTEADSAVADVSAEAGTDA